MSPAETRRAAEAWFVDQGLPYFVDENRRQVQARLSRPRLTIMAVVAGTSGVLVGLLVGGASGEASLGVSAGTSTAALVVAAYALVLLKAWLWFRWAVRRSLGSLELLVPLVTRALPMLLLFVTFLFINTEVWQVADTLDGGVMWAAVMLFAGIAVAFLLTRLPEELDAIGGDLDPPALSRACVGTPLASAALAVTDVTDADGPVTGLQRANLVLVLLVAQMLQVLLLAVAVFVFFIGFGLVAMDPSVIESWLGHPPEELGWRVTRELIQVATFLAAFSGLYFAVYAVTDETYRRQFFHEITDEMQRAVAARVVYRTL